MAAAARDGMHLMMAPADRRCRVTIDRVARHAVGICPGDTILIPLIVFASPSEAEQAYEVIGRWRAGELVVARPPTELERTARGGARSMLAWAPSLTCDACAVLECPQRRPRAQCAYGEAWQRTADEIARSGAEGLLLIQASSIQRWLWMRHHLQTGGAPRHVWDAFARLEDRVWSRQLELEHLALDRREVGIGTALAGVLFERLTSSPAITHCPHCGERLPDVIDVDALRREGEGGGADG